jgi:hypothetical protein
MPYAGKTLMPRDVALSCYDLTPWRNYELTKALATALAESAGSIGAWHDNLGSDGVTVASRDCGLFQINIPAAEIGTAAELALRTDSTDPTVYQPVLENNVMAAFRLYEEPWTRNGNPDIRRFEAWVAYIEGWATFPEWWVWHQDNGNPIGPWLATGRYVQRAIAGQMNNHVVNLKDWPVTMALTYGKKYAEHFGIDPDLLHVTGAGVLGWTVPVMPGAPPVDGVGPRPVPNDGT